MEIDLGVLQLNTEEAEVYRTVLVSGQLSKAEILDATKLSNDQVVSVINGLIEKKLLRKVPGMIDRFACLLPLGSTKKELEEASTEVEVLGREISSTAEQELSSLKTQLEQSKANLKQQVDQKVDSLNQSVSDIETSSIESKQQAEQRVTTSKEEKSQQVSSTVSSLQSKTIDKVTQLYNEGSSRISAKQEGISRSASEARSGQEGIKEEALSGLEELDTNALQATKKETETSVGNVFETTTQHLENVKQKIQGVVDDINTGFATEIPKIQSTGEEFSNRVKSSVQETVTSLGDQVDQQVEEFSTTKTSVSASLQSSKETLDTGKQHYNTATNNQSVKINQLETKTEESLDQIRSTLQGKTNTATDQLTQFLNSSGTALANQQGQLKEKLQQLIEQQKQDILTTLQSHVTQFMEDTTGKLDQTITEFTSALNSSAETLSQERNQLKQNTQQELLTTKETLQSQFAADVGGLKENHATTLAAAREEFQQINQQFDENIQVVLDKIETTQQRTSNSIDQQSQGIRSWYQQVESEISSTLETQDQILQEALTGAFNSLSQQLSQKSEELSSETQQSFSSINSQIQEIKAQSTQNAGNAVQQAIATMTTLHENLMGRLTQALDQSKQQYTSLINSNEEKSSELITQLEQDMEVIKQDMTTSLQSQLSAVGDQFSELLDTVHSEVNQLLQTVQSSIQNQISQSKQVGTQILQSVEELSSEGTASQIDAVERTFNTYGQKYKESTSQVSDKVSALAKILDGIFSLQEDTETPEIKTTHVVGKSAIIKYMNEMIGRVKSKMTILAPDISMVADSKILELPMTAQVTIVSEIDKITHQDWIEKMHGSKANVTLRTLTEQGFGAKLPDFIGCEREGEEIIIGTMDEGNDDYVAIASNSENFVKIFGSQIISEYSRGRSRQIQK